MVVGWEWPGLAIWGEGRGEDGEGFKKGGFANYGVREVFSETCKVLGFHGLLQRWWYREWV